MSSNQVDVGLDTLSFDNRFTETLPKDPIEENYRRVVLGACYSEVRPTPVREPSLVAYAPEVAELIGLPASSCEEPLFSEVFSGNELLPGMNPYATCYGGHQFGNWAGQLGDGRAINLGEIVNKNNERYTLQLKGAGPTPYSRSADGLAVLRSSLREFLCSEAMFHLGVPTTRALSLVLTGEEVLRDMFYDGNAGYEPGAVVCRVAASFTRFGHFQFYAVQKDPDLLKNFVDYTIENDFEGYDLPKNPTDAARKNIYAAWFEEVCQRTADMIAHWMRVGFVHGVMNTDNMSITGLTIDYGPYGWLENYDAGWTPNTTDAQGRRYCFGNQPKIAQWNLVQLANAIYPLVGDAAPLEHSLESYATHYKKEWSGMLANKLGLLEVPHELEEQLFTLLQSVETDMTLFFRFLSDVKPANFSEEDFAIPKPLLPAYYLESQLDDAYKQQLQSWLVSYGHAINKEGRAMAERAAQMNKVNPLYVLRNYIAQNAIDAVAKGDNAPVSELLDVLKDPYNKQTGKEAFAQKRPEWARNRPGCSMLSCSS